MTQNPYSQQPGFDLATPARTSVVAILSLVCALLCPIPGLGLLAIVLGIAALFMIAGSQGRVAGKGLAISGIVLGLIVSLAWGGGLYLANQAGKFINQAFMGTATSIFQNIESKNYAQARTLLNTPSSAPSPTDADFDAFLAAYQADLGQFKSLPSGILEYFSKLSTMQGIYQPAPGQPIMPIPAEFANGTGVVLLEMPQGYQKGAPPNKSALPILNVGVATKPGTVIWLIPKGGANTPSGGSGAGTGGTGGSPPPSSGNGG